MPDWSGRRSEWEAVKWRQLDQGAGKERRKRAAVAEEPGREGGPFKGELSKFMLMQRSW